VEQNKGKRKDLFACTDESLHKSDIADINMDDNNDDDDGDFFAGYDSCFYAKDGQK
jgi:hypothetical protein